MIKCNDKRVKISKAHLQNKTKKGGFVNDPLKGTVPPPNFVTFENELGPGLYSHGVGKAALKK